MGDIEKGFAGEVLPLDSDDDHSGVEKDQSREHAQERNELFGFWGASKDVECHERQEKEEKRL